MLHTHPLPKAYSLMPSSLLFPAYILYLIPILSWHCHPYILVFIIAKYMQ